MYVCMRATVAWQLLNGYFSNAYLPLRCLHFRVLLGLFWMFKPFVRIITRRLCMVCSYTFMGVRRKTRGFFNFYCD